LFDKSIRNVMGNKAGLPKAADVVQAAGTLGEVVTYNQAYRAVRQHGGRLRITGLDSYQLIIPYLTAFNKDNEHSMFTTKLMM
jgi:hypothetical protein